MGLKTDAFNTCLDSGKYTLLVNNQTNIARQLGLESTPSFALNGQKIVGAQSFDTFKQAIDALLNQ
jgi:protein-disulfide isomerase